MVQIEAEDNEEEEKFYDLPPEEGVSPPDNEDASTQDSCKTTTADPTQPPGENDLLAETTIPERTVEERISEAEALKAEGNAYFGTGELESAVEKYTCALAAAPEDASQRSVYYANRAACYLQQEQYQDVVTDCTASLKINETYVKALKRRAQAHEHLDELERALEDYRKIAEQQAGDKEVQQNIRRLEPIVTERTEKMKEEMMGKLKDLGNSVLGHFGLSVDNFKATKDPNTGSYSINFQQ
ncbi:hypothetical protein CYMTET_24026 [Cymbomonas tetramitiformis]|uniref:Tetratricopeptide repeat protein 1 n=1 Tax=Cymbomonas tetramitiformis TaxID=36881 RepID=A0AAE0FWP9_9CHLO|nr:hypothetical protein CYMTET_24026 [Cymbomonas tetramitiformis]